MIIKKDFLIKSVMKLFLLTYVFFFISACGTSEKAEHIEAYTIEVYVENEKGISEISGYMKINAITTIEEGKHHIKADIKTIEDSYDTEGNYIKTEIIHSFNNKSNVTLAEEGDKLKKELHEPSTILIPDDKIKHFQSVSLKEEEKRQLKEHVLSFMEKL